MADEMARSPKAPIMGFVSGFANLKRRLMSLNPDALESCGDSFDK
jgi:hypothetical protein